MLTFANEEVKYERTNQGVQGGASNKADPNTLSGEVCSVFASHVLRPNHP
jgi:hypothetical protein